MDRDTVIALNKEAREQMKKKLLADIAADMMVCSIEGLDHREYAGELCEEITRIAIGFKTGSALVDWRHICGRCGSNISIFTDECKECGAKFDMSQPFVRKVLEVDA